MLYMTTKIELTARELLRIAIERSGEHQYDAAKKIGMRPQVLSEVLSGRVNPTAAEKAAIEKQFGVPADEWK